MLREIIDTCIRSMSGRHFFRVDAADRIEREMLAWRQARHYPATHDQVIERLVRALQCERLDPECYPPLVLHA